MQGFSIPDVIIMILILAILTTLSLMGITKAQSSFHLSNGGETLKAYLEKAFSDAKRRHARGETRTKIQVTGLSTYQVKIDFDGNGVLETQNLRLPGKVTFVYDPATPPVATIDWRGNVAEGNVVFNLKSDQDQTMEVAVSSNGDTSVDTEFSTLPTVTVTPTSSDINNLTVLVGNSAPNLYPSPTPTPTPLPYCSGGQKPAIDICRCKNDKPIRSDGKCG